MIPRRVYLRGFLSYRDEQEVRFDGSSLWMLSGLNGSGKSSVFDALTYALFGHHRGGSQRAEGLINKESNGAVVEFDFTQDGEVYRARRTLQRDGKGGARGTQQIMRWQPGPGEGRFVAIEDTSRRTAFDDWIREHIGLDFETFTSSVLLLQGKAEKLLDARAKGRFEVLAGIVDLERYRRLHEKADGRRKLVKGELEGLRSQIENQPEIGPLELVTAENRIAEAEVERQRAAAEVENCRTLEFQAKQWGELQAKQGGLRQKWQQAQALVAEAAAVESDLARLRILREALPHVETVCKQRQQAQQAEVRLAGLNRDREDLDGKIAERTQALKEIAQKRASLAQKRTAADERLQQVGAELTKLAAVLERAKQYESQKQRLARQEEEIARLPGGTQEALEAAQRRSDAAAALARALPLLERLHTQRRGLREALAALKTAGEQEVAIKTKGEKLRAEQEAAQKGMSEASAARETAEKELSAAAALLRQVQDDFTAFTELEGARLCRACGQPLTPAHFAAEKAKRDRALAEAVTRHDRASAVRNAAHQAEQKRRTDLQTVTASLESTREAYRETRSAAQQARTEAERCRGECGRAWNDLAESFRSRVAGAPPDDWSLTTYPDDADLTTLRREAKGFDAAQRALTEAQQRHGQWMELAAAATALRNALHEMEADLPADVGALRRKHVAFATDQSTLSATLTAAREEDRALAAEAERLAREREVLQSQRADREARIKGDEALRQAALNAVAAALKALAPDWRPIAEQAGLADVHTLTSEREQLDGKGVEARYQDLERTRQSLEALRQQMAGLEAECERVPSAARRPLPEVQALLLQARQHYGACDQAHRHAEREHAALVQQKERRDELQAKLLAGESELKVMTQLASLLGRDRLQLYLVRQAERQIVDHANAVLDRLSGGQLFLRLCSGAEGDAGSDEALELEAYNRTTGSQPINVSFLSGSQRFRVAVSLALGIGQYASRQHRPIESVIIDEGFGCLDRNGRQVMIQELHNLRGHLHCILLVSHQEEFADAFNDGYHFALEDGSTKVTRVQR